MLHANYKKAFHGWNNNKKYIQISETHFMRQVNVLWSKLIKPEKEYFPFNTHNTSSALLKFIEPYIQKACLGEIVPEHT